MTDTPPYTGPVEALSLEAAAARFGVSGDFIKADYPGPFVYLGEGKSLLRYPAYGLHDWLASKAQYKADAAGGAGDWGDVGHVKEVQKRKKRKA